MSFMTGGDDFSNWERFAESYDIDPYDAESQDTYYEFIYENHGVGDRSDDESMAAMFAFFDMIYGEDGYDYEDIYERYSE